MYDKECIECEYIFIIFNLGLNEVLIFFSSLCK